MKSTNGQSLRCQVEKWLAPAPTTPVRVTAFSRTRLGGQRYVCVETLSPSGVHALFFFKHDDGNWHVFPQAANSQNLAADRPLMHAATPSIDSGCKSAAPKASTI
ncbi:hypothetical protein A6V36_18630 [Paraburkholderia ginsengiterrae]|uniref:Uncharacterized protein n=1 Tax=Paraburkholderia ginsengiterrae TaxID=1462993 RepID=A0A1A9MXR7_9BURK|nr:hypothetical protein A6V37_10810 [Paraburkholderia ginsengiterrae]OAJ63498.1 hypothetical protein A6V36_18630 [Paraburkholderia ginsengiterrae]